ncbi:unnamed protein product [Urochloa decumbens]|uniref:non-specific serine/threonine protein kinase n=1 Tax=Urochloa decumbens TaxID=240449 RepID=A0ABC9AJF8_9POAL
MTDPVATVEKIVKIGLKIKDAVDTVRHNEEECREIRKRVLRFSAILSQLQQTGMMNDSPATSGALEDLEESIQQALELVTACQERSTIRRLVTAGDLSKQLRRVKDDILNKDGGVIDSTDDAKGVLKGGNIVAIKRSYRTDYSTWTQSNYNRLLVVVSKLQHKNIVKFIGYCYQVLSTSEVQLFKRKKGQPREREFIWVEEFAATGSLEVIIHECQLNWSSLFRIIQGIAQGLLYLHEQRVVHMDVKPLNILLDSDRNPKITDFELSVVLSDNEITHHPLMGTMGYAAPEHIAEGIVSTKNDVYAFGITLLETVSSMCKSKQPRGLVHGRDWEAWKAELMKEEFNPALFEASDLKQIRRCMRIGLLCARLNRTCRPNMAEVLEMLNGNQKLLNDPKEPASPHRLLSQLWL